MANTKLPIVDPMPKPLDPPSSKVIERKVYIKVVENVEEHDFPQAMKTWQALEEAGIEPGELVANALEEGHNYQSNQNMVNMPFRQKQDLPIAESVVEDSRLVSYQYINDERLLADPKANQDPNQMEIVLTSKEVGEVESDKFKPVRMIAILRKKLPDLLK